MKKKGNVREMRKRIAACVYYVLFTLYTHIHMYTVYAQLEVIIVFPTGKSRLLFQHLLSFAQHHQVGICAVNHPIPEKEVICC